MGLAFFQVVTGNETGAVVLPADLCFPPSVVLMPQDGENVAFSKRQFFGDGRLIHVHRAGWENY